MAGSNSGNRALLTGSDAVTDNLLSHVSHFVIGPVSKQFATGPLGLRDEQYDNIEEENSKAQRRKYEVLRMWRNKSCGETVATFIDKLVLWQLAGYMTGQVWDKIGKTVDPSVLPTETQIPTATKRWEDEADNVRAVPHVTPCVFEEDWMRDIQTYTKETLRRRLRNYLSNDWLPVNKAKSFPLKRFYVELNWTNTIKGLQDMQEPMNRIHDIFTLNFGSSAVTELVRGEPGIGKSCSMAMLAMDWAEDDTTAEPVSKKAKSDLDTGVKNFDFVFLIQLSKVDSDVSLEEVIIQQHGRLKSTNVPKDQITTILQRKKVLLLFDGYDEYKKGSNRAIDNAITNTLGNCFVIITSRPGDYMEKSDVDQMDGEIQITGLSEENILKCATGYLQSLLASRSDKQSIENTCRNLIQEAWNVGIYDLLRIPIILLMVCVLYSHEQSLPNTKTDIVWEIIKMCMDRSTIKHLGKKWNDLQNIYEMLFILGELSWLALLRNTKQLLIRKTDVENTGYEDILQLGLLHSADQHAATFLEEPKWLTYPHKLFQDFLAGYYGSKRSLQDVKAMFKSWEDIEQKFEVFLFTCGIMEDPSSAINYMCEQYVNYIERSLKHLMNSYFVSYYKPENYFVKVSKEIRNKKKFLNPFCNEHFYHILELPLKRQSRLYYFGKNLDWMEIGGNRSTSQTACNNEMRTHYCRIVITNTCLTPQDVLKAISSLRQTITDLVIDGPFVVSDEVWKNNPAHVFKIDPLATCIHLAGNVLLPTNVSKSLGQELSTCYNLHELSIHKFSVAVEIVDWLGLNTKLIVLDLSFCNIPIEKSVKLCQQFKHLSNLEYCNLSDNVLGDAVSILAESIQSWGTKNSLNTLELRNCKVTSHGCTRLLEALGICTNLKWLDLSYNTISGAFDGLTSKSIYPGLNTITLAGTALSSGDIKAIGSSIQEHRMPNLFCIHLSYNNVDNLEHDTLETLESLNFIIHEEHQVFFWKGDRLQDLDKIQESITKGILRQKSKKITNT